jgi:hypothetical protein
MNLTSLFRFFIIAFVVIYATSLTQSHAQVTPTMRMQIFNGNDLNGWTYTGKGKFLMEDKTLKTDGGPGLLWYSDRVISNAILRVVYKTSDKLASAAVFVRIPERPKTLAQAERGYKVQIDDTGDDYHVTGTLSSFTKAMVRFSKPNQWNTLEITLDSGRTSVSINGAKVTEFKEGDAVPPRKDSSEPERGPRPVEGYIGLYNNCPAGAVYFREVSIRPLDTKTASKK